MILPMASRDPETAAGLAPAPDRFLSRREAAEFLTLRGYKVEPATLAKYVTVGGGPILQKFGRRPLYRPADLLAWAAARTGPRRASSSEDRACHAE